MTKPLIIRPFGMSAEVAERIIQAWDNAYNDVEDTYIEEWCEQGEGDSRLKLVQSLKRYRTPGDIASFSRGYHDAISRKLPLAYVDRIGQTIDNVQTDYYRPRGWSPSTYIEGWKRATDHGVYEAEVNRDTSHYRFTTLDGGNGCLYVREMSFNRREGRWFEWSRILDYMTPLAPNAIDIFTVDYLAGRTMCDEVLELPWPGYHKDHDVGGIRSF